MGEPGYWLLVRACRARTGNGCGQWDGSRANTQGPVAMANTLSPGTVPASARAINAQLELRAMAPTWQATATLQDQWQQGQGNTTRAWINEAVLNAEVGDSQSVPEKNCVLGCGLRLSSNHVVQQEARRSPVAHMTSGRGPIMAEQFVLDSAWSVVWVNPGHGPQEQAGRENALALRYYQRQGAVDWMPSPGAACKVVPAWVWRRLGGHGRVSITRLGTRYPPYPTGGLGCTTTGCAEQHARTSGLKGQTPKCCSVAPGPIAAS